MDNQLAMNIIPLKTLLAHGKTKDDIIATNLMVTIVTGEATRTLEIIPLLITVGSKTSVNTFFAINTTASYNLLPCIDFCYFGERLDSC